MIFFSLFLYVTICLQTQIVQLSKVEHYQNNLPLHCLGALSGYMWLDALRCRHSVLCQSFNLGEEQRNGHASLCWDQPSAAPRCSCALKQINGFLSGCAPLWNHIRSERPCSELHELDGLWSQAICDHHDGAVITLVVQHQCSPLRLCGAPASSYCPKTCVLV